MSTKILDHIPHLAPAGTLAESIEAFKDLGFTWAYSSYHRGIRRDSELT